MTTEPVLEQLSALADGELPSAEAGLLLARLARDADLRRAWERYHVCGEAMRRALSPACDRSFTARVMAALDGDAALAAPRRAVRWTRALAGGAIAASVAFLAVLGIRTQVADPAGEVVPRVASGGSAVLGVQAVDFDPQQAELEAKLNSYLLDHGTTAGRRLQGVMPLVHIATHDAGRDARATKKDAEPPVDAAAQAGAAPAPADDDAAARPAERPRP